MLAEIVVCYPIKKKQTKFWIRLIAGFIVCSLVAACGYFIRKMPAISNFLTKEKMGDVYALIWFVGMTVLAYGYMRFCFKQRFEESLFFMIMASVFVSVKNTAFDWLLGDLLFPQIRDYTAVYVILSIVMMAFIYFVMYWLFPKRLKGNYELYVDKPFIAIYAVIILTQAALTYSFHYTNDIINGLQAVPEYLLPVNGTLIQILLILINLSHALFVSIILYNKYKYNRANIEKVVINEMYSKELRQYQILKANTEYLSEKIHDMKYVLKALESGMTYDKEEFANVQNIVAEMSAFFKTGNETLDAVLTDTGLICRKYDIQLTCIADGAALSFIKELDIYVLFSNILNNAVEYVQKISDKDNRYIRLTVSKKFGQYLILHQENYFTGELQMKDGFPVTTKTDGGLHGYGTKSINQMVKKYKGEIEFKVVDSSFNIDITLPIER